MKISLVLKDTGAGPQIIFSSDEPEEARKFYKAHDDEGRVYLVCNPTPEGSKLNKGLVAVSKPMPRRKADTGLL